LLVAPDDPAALAGAIESLLADAALAARLGARARQRFEAGFTEATMFDRTIDVYREACAVQR
jgi:glycosyltransferase involved in cell wall biosynthesis